MSKKRLFYKSIIWQIIGMIWISLLSYLWFGNWIQSLGFTTVVVIVSIFSYVFYETLWKNLQKIKNFNNHLMTYIGRTARLYFLNNVDTAN